MKTALVPPASKKVNWIPLPDPLTETEVNIQFNWTADARTTAALERQAKGMGFESPHAYILQLFAATLAGNEADSVLTDDGRVVCESLYAYDPAGLPQNV